MRSCDGDRRRGKAEMKFAFGSLRVIEYVLGLHDLPFCDYRRALIRPPQA